MASGVAPVKPEYRRKAVFGVLVEAVLGSTAPAAADAADATQPSGRDQRPQQAQKKSRNQQKKDRKQARQSKTELCHAFTHERCRFGDGCRFSHDVAAYLAAKPADLPGRCPFSAADACPHGITCRWATTHVRPDALTREHLAAPRTAAVANSGGAEAAPEAAPPRPAVVAASSTADAAPQFAEDATWAAGGGVNLQRSNDAAAAAGLSADTPAATAEGGTELQTDSAAAAAAAALPEAQTQPQNVAARGGAGPAQAGGSRAAAALSDAAWLDAGSGDSSIAAVSNAAGVGGSGRQAAASGIEELPVATSLPASTNFLDKGVQSQLRRNAFDFSRADGVLQQLGIKGGRQTNKPAAKAQRQQQGSKQQQNGQQPGDEHQQHGQQQPNGHQAGASWAGNPRSAQPSRHAAAAAAALEAELSGDEAPAAAQPAQQNVHASPVAATDRDTSQHHQPTAVAAPGVEVSVGEQDRQPAAKRQRLHAADGSGGAASPASAVPPAADGASPMDESPAASAVTDTVAAAPSAAAAAAANAPGTAVHDSSSSQPQSQPLFDIRSAAAAGADAPQAPLRAAEKKQLDLRGKTYLAPLTTVGNLPFRRLCKQLGVDITCGEMAMATNIIQGTASEWALLRRHPSEHVFGAQICGGFPDAAARCCQLLDEYVDLDFVDINMGCPIDLVCNKGAGSALLQKPGKMEAVVRAASATLSCPLTVKLRKGYYDGKDVARDLIPRVAGWGAAAVTLHGRTRQQRYSRLADWDYIQGCASTLPEGFQMLGNGDVYNYEQWNSLLGGGSRLASLMVGRAALIKPWIFTEIKEQRHWDISAAERLDLLKDFCAAGLTHWGSDSKGVETTRRFLLEWLSFTHRYIPVGLLETASQAAHLNWRNPGIVGRSDLECLLSSDDPRDWVSISERLLGPPPPGFLFQPKHKAQTHARSEMDMALTADDAAENG